jgi:hypothetical protein
MSLRAFIWAIRALVCGGCIMVGLITLLLDPSATASFWVTLLFSLSISIILGILFLFLIGAYRLIREDGQVVLLLGIIFRQATLLTLGGLALFLLWRGEKLFWWSTLFVALFLLLSELTLGRLGKKKKINRQKQI